jgi:methylenetetrahydrofolate reductase (NADPH)
MKRAILDEALENAKKLGIRNILALRGDPPREDEYGDPNALENGQTDEKESSTEEEKVEFVWAVDLVKYIRKRYGDFFCIGVAAYPDGHADESYPEKQDPMADLPYLVEKVQAGADFIMTQLFFDSQSFISFEKALREHPSGAFNDMPIIPGLMPIQSYQIFRRTTKLSHAKVPESVLTRLDGVKGDDEEVKRVGIDMLCEIVDTLRHTSTSPSTNSKAKRGFHFFTLNLEKTVTQIVERSKLIRDLHLPSGAQIPAIEISEHELMPPENSKSLERRRLSAANSTPVNRVIVESKSTAANSDYEALQAQAGVPAEDNSMTRSMTMKISEGEGAMGREATWDDFPNGRWGDARSPGKRFQNVVFHANSDSLW